jgi:hypothetical protein
MSATPSNVGTQKEINLYPTMIAVAFGRFIIV